MKFDRKIMKNATFLEHIQKEGDELMQAQVPRAERERRKRTCFVQASWVVRTVVWWCGRCSPFH